MININIGLKRLTAMKIALLFSNGIMKIFYGCKFARSPGLGLHL